MPRGRNATVASKVLWLMVLVNVLLAAWLSPLTSIRRVKVEGASASYRPYIASTLKKQSGVAALRVDPLQIESKIMASSAVLDADFRRNIFGRGVLRIRYRVPVATLESDDEICLDETGCLYRSLNTPKGLPILDLFDGAVSPELSVMGSWPAKRIAELAQLAKRYSAGRQITVEVQSSGAVSLRTQSGATIRLGPPEEFDRKFAKLDAMLNREPELFRLARSINLTAPENATWLPR